MRRIKEYLESLIVSKFSPHQLSKEKIDLLMQGLEHNMVEWSWELDELDRSTREYYYSMEDAINRCFTEDKLKLYLQEFTSMQLSRIMECFLPHMSLWDEVLTVDQVEMLADPKYNSGQMFQIALGFRLNFTKEQIETYADPRLTREEMSRRVNSLLCDLKVQI